MAGSAKHVSSLSALFQKFENIWCKQHLYYLVFSQAFKITILLSNCFLLLPVMIAFSFVSIWSFWHYVCWYNVYQENIHNPAFQFFCQSVSIRSRASLNKDLPGLNVTFPGYTEIFYNLALTCWHLSHFFSITIVSLKRDYNGKHLTSTNETMKARKMIFLVQICRRF